MLVSLYQCSGEPIFSSSKVKAEGVEELEAREGTGLVIGGVQSALGPGSVASQSTREQHSETSTLRREGRRRILADTHSTAMDLRYRLEHNERDWLREKAELLERFDVERREWESQLKDMQRSDKKKNTTALNAALKEIARVSEELCSYQDEIRKKSGDKRNRSESLCLTEESEMTFGHDKTRLEVDEAPCDLSQIYNDLRALERENWITLSPNNTWRANRAQSESCRASAAADPDSYRDTQTSPGILSEMDTAAPPIPPRTSSWNLSTPTHPDTELHIPESPMTTVRKCHSPCVLLDRKCSSPSIVRKFEAMLQENEGKVFIDGVIASCSVPTNSNCNMGCCHNRWSCDASKFSSNSTIQSPEVQPRQMRCGLEGQEPGQNVEGSSSKNENPHGAKPQPARVGVLLQPLPAESKQRQMTQPGHQAQPKHASIPPSQSDSSRHGPRMMNDHPWKPLTLAAYPRPEGSRSNYGALERILKNYESAARAQQSQNQQSETASSPNLSVRQEETVTELDMLDMDPLPLPPTLRHTQTSHTSQIHTTHAQLSSHTAMGVKEMQLTVQENEESSVSSFSVQKNFSRPARPANRRLPSRWASRSPSSSSSTSSSPSTTPVMPPSFPLQKHTSSFTYSHAFHIETVII
ncbi:protein SOGA3a isoform X1 [Lates japonicus]|uniref:Protein SOGA3a isoform X1 n=1 Tax=Lates japonicus TaxID=270547 RepID=A0AAD3QXR0_LATJO|nr:protein SOGA3a isoform X1 [Lates japonicus]